MNRLLAILTLILLAAPAQAQLRIVFPNGGERFNVGSTQLISWRGSAPTDTLRIEYSTDAGGSWNLITDRGVGISHVWTPVPNTPSDRCLLRISTKTTTTDSVLFLPARPDSFGIEAIHYAEFSPDGARVVGAGATGNVYIWNSFTKQVIRRIPVEPIPTNFDGSVLVSRARYSPDGALIATVSPFMDTANTTVRIFDANSGALIRQWIHPGFARRAVTVACAFSPDGSRLLVTGERGGTIYNVADGTQAQKLQGYSDSIPPSLFFHGFMIDGDWSPDGASIVGAENLVQQNLQPYVLNNVATGDTVRTFRAHVDRSTLSSIRFSPNADRFISTSFDSTARVFDLATGGEVFRIQGYTRIPLWGEYSHAGTVFGTVGEDSVRPFQTLKLYDATTGAFIRNVGSLNAGMHNLNFNPDDSRIVVSCGDGARIFQAPGNAPGASDVSDSLWSIVINPGGTVTVAAGTASARQGDNVEIPITIDNPGLALGAGATRVDATLALNASLLEPVDSTPIGTLSGTTRAIQLSLPLVSDQDTVLAILRFRAALGDDSTSTLDLSNLTTDQPTVTVNERDGLFRLLDLCYEGGPRLLNPNARVAIRSVAPNPTTHSLEVEIHISESGPTRLDLVDALGNIVDVSAAGVLPTGTHQLHFDLHGIPSGHYFLRLKTPTVVETIPVEVRP